MMRSKSRWGYRTGLLWIGVTAIYFYAHFAWVFWNANREGIAALWTRLTGG